MPNMPMIAYAQVSKSFGKSFDDGHDTERVVAVDDVSLEVADGEFLASNAARVERPSRHPVSHLAMRADPPPPGEGKN